MKLVNYKDGYYNQRNYWNRKEEDLLNTNQFERFNFQFDKN